MSADPYYRAHLHDPEKRIPCTVCGLPPDHPSYRSAPAMRPLAQALTDERRRGEAVHGGVIVQIMDMEDDQLARAESDLFDYLTTGPARYPQANWKLTAVVYAAVVEERAYRELLLNKGL